MFNKLIVLGYLARNIELKYTTTGTAVAKACIATSYKYKATNTEQKDETCFLEFVILGKTAQNANTYLHKGSKVLFEGRLKQETWSAKDGTARSRHILMVENMKMLDSMERSGILPSANKEAQGFSSKAQGITQEVQEMQDNKIEEEIPF